MPERTPICPMCGSENLTRVPHDEALGASGPKCLIIAYNCECGITFTVWKPVVSPDALPPANGSG
ncbi:MAG: hypothetical protein ACR2FY_19140 [Pirellulaceae bacterium]